MNKTLSWLRVLASRIRGLLTRHELDQDFQQELDSHLSLLTEENLRRGLSPEEARRAARVRLGGVTQLRETHRELHGLPSIETFAQDIRYALRTLRRAKWISLAAVATLALGIGANTAVFSVVDTVLLRSLPFHEPDRLVMLAQRDPRTGAGANTYFAPTTFFDWSSQNHSFTSMSAVEDFQATLAGRGEPVQLAGQAVSASFLGVLGVRPVLGRNFAADEDFPNRNNVALLSYALWQSRFGGSRAALGQSITLNGFPVTVIGVLPPDFEFLSSLPSLWVPLGLDPSARWSEGRDIQIVARLRPGASVEQAQIDLTTLTRRLGRDGPVILTGTDTEATLMPLIESYVGEVRPALLVLLGAVLCVLLIAYTNVANLLLARSTARRREMAVRASLGASRGRLVRQLLTESLVLAGIGGVLGVLVAWWGARFLVGLVPASMPIPRLEELGPNFTILAFTLAMTLATAFLVGLVPASQASRQEVSLSMWHGGRGTAGGGGRLRGGLVVLEVAMAMMLLVGAGLLLRTFSHLRAINPGFSDRNVLACHVMVPEAQYRTGVQQAAFFAQVLERIRRLPGVRSAAAIDHLPVSGHGSSTWIHVAGRPEPPPGQQLDALARSVTPGYFATLGVPLYAGRDFTDADTGVLDVSKKIDPATSPLKLIVNQALVDRFLPGENPLGQRLGIFWGQTLVGEIVGVVGNVRYQSLAEPEEPTFYWPEAQRPHHDMHLVVRTEGRPADWVGAVRGAVRSVDPSVPVADVQTLTDVVALASSRTRFSLVLLAAFASIALLLAAVGLFGVMAYNVAQRTAEIGVRMALGAKPAAIIAMMLWDGMRLVLIGLVGGIGAAAGLTRFLSTELYGVKATDGLTFVTVTLTLLATALAAVFLPARRASNVEPVTALRYE
ncbi:MAG TPA: ABC transporter permease [Terriglobia bacterium]|nr:ABC transporter permease [Terriglobia bacterium]